MSETTKQSHSEQQAAAQLESIKEMVAALECDYERLEELRDEREGWEPAEDSEPRFGTWAEEFPEEAEELAELEKASTIDGQSYTDSDEARERIQEDPLSVQVRSDWCDVGSEDLSEPSEYCILLCTGGPACRIVGELQQREPHTARIEHQDWGTPWQEYITTGSDHEALLAYCRCFYFGD